MFAFSVNDLRRAELELYETPDKEKYQKADAIRKLHGELRIARYHVHLCDKEVMARCVENYAPLIRERLEGLGQINVNKTEREKFPLNVLIEGEMGDTRKDARPLAVIIGGSVGLRQAQLFSVARKEYFGEKRPVVINGEDLRYEHPLALAALLSNGVRLENIIGKEVRACGFKMLASALGGRRNIVYYDPMRGWENIASVIEQIRKHQEYRVMVLAAAVHGVIGRAEILESCERGLALTGTMWKGTADRQCESHLFMPHVLNYLERNGIPDLIKIYNNRMTKPHYVNNMGRWTEEKRKGEEDDARSVFFTEARRRFSDAIFERYRKVSERVIERMKARDASAEEIADTRMKLELFLNRRENQKGAQGQGKQGAENLSPVCAV
ncbi:MAG: zeta toxin family protein [Synergistaceae bacterium]|jgi:hypothetical protein|nr:zeta toxin family protein [Synergistaceae bacterium]